MDDIVNVTPENYLQVINTLLARLKRIEQHLHLEEPENDVDAAPLPAEPVLEVTDEQKLVNEEAAKRYVQLKTHLSPFVDKHLKEERGLFLDGAAARGVLHSLFVANAPPGFTVSPAEQKKLSRWVTSSLKAWRRKDFLRLMKSAFHAHMVQMFGPEQKDWPLEGVANEAMNWVDSEVVLKYELAPIPADGSSIVKSDLLPPSFRRFMVTIVHNLVPREANDFLPEYLQWRASDLANAPPRDDSEEVVDHEEPLEPNGNNVFAGVEEEEVDEAERMVEEEEDAVEAEAVLDHEEAEEMPRSRNAKRKSRTPPMLHPHQHLDLPQEGDEEEEEPQSKRNRNQVVSRGKAS